MIEYLPKILVLIFHTLVLKILLGINLVYSDELVTKQLLKIEATIVASTCFVYIESNQGSGIIDFGEYDKYHSSKNIVERFKVKIYEPGASLPGCSAFKAGTDNVTLGFGNKGQLDENGVVTKGAGDKIRIQINSEDNSFSNNSHFISSKNNKYIYPRKFAELGSFKFRAKLDGLEDSTLGEFKGSLSLIVVYK
ncbi:fimbrial protein [Vibrio sp. nBUS_14]|uniref:fimbrial protein n=1 Tax=Vibrio sp. nBUS_14 TaxID=3395321 RepID=UPI003EBBAD6F